MEETKLRLFLLPDFDKTLLPTPAVRNRDWWNDSDKTRKHAQHCLPLMMANSLGLYILSPATFEVRWTGDPKDDADIDILEAASHAQVDSHAAHGSFTIAASGAPIIYDQITDLALAIGFEIVSIHFLCHDFRPLR